MKKSAPPDTKRSFPSAWSELAYLCQKIRYWLYERRQRSRGMHYRDRLASVLADLPESDMAIIREEGLALLCELDGKIDEAIAHRSREIKLMERLHREARLPRYDDDTRAYMLRDRDTDALDDRRLFLQSLKEVAAGRTTRQR